MICNATSRQCCGAIESALGYYLSTPTPGQLSTAPAHIRMNHNARRIDRILSDAPLAATLLARLAAAREAAGVIAPICAEVAPDFDPTRPGACDLRDHVLRIWLRSSAHSTKLRQAIPRMTARLQGHGLKVNEIKVGVQLGRVREKVMTDWEGKPGGSPPIPGKINRTAKDYLLPIAFSEKLALTLPDSDLRRAAVRLGLSLQTRLAGIRDSNQSFYDQNGEKKDARGQPAGKKPPRP